MNKIFEILFFFIGGVSLAIMSLMPVYLIVKYKTINAIAYWEYASKKEMCIMRIGYIGFLLVICMVIIYGILSNI